MSNSSELSDYVDTASESEEVLQSENEDVVAGTADEPLRELQTPEERRQRRADLVATRKPKIDAIVKIRKLLTLQFGRGTAETTPLASVTLQVSEDGSALSLLSNIPTLPSDKAIRTTNKWSTAEATITKGVQRHRRTALRWEQLAAYDWLLDVCRIDPQPTSEIQARGILPTLQRTKTITNDDPNMIDLGCGIGSVESIEWLSYDNGDKTVVFTFFRPKELLISQAGNKVKKNVKGSKKGRNSKR